MNSAKAKHDASQARRKMRNKLRRQGDPARLLKETQIRINGNVVKCDGIRAQHHYALIRAEYIRRLGVHHEASKKKDQSHLWQHRETRTAGDFIREDGTRPARGKQTKRK